MVSFVDAEEANPHRAELRRQRHPERAAGTETQYVGVEVEQPVGVGGRHHDMAQALIAGDEFRAERGDDRAVVEHRTVEHLERGAGRVLEGDHLLDPARLGLVGGQLLERTPAPSRAALTRCSAGVVAHLPADGEHPVGLAGHDDDAGPRARPSAGTAPTGRAPCLRRNPARRRRTAASGRCRWSK